MTATPYKYPKPRPSMRGRYLIRAPVKKTLLAAMDLLLNVRRHPRTIMPAEPKSILIANWAHLGDVIVTLPALKMLRERHRGAKIGFLAGSWSQALLAHTGFVDRIHVIDHWNLDRAPGGRLRHFLGYWRQRGKLIQELKKEEYEVGIDFYPYFPPASPLFLSAGIPTRIGFTSGAFGPLLTHSRNWPDEARHIIDMQRDLLNILEAEDPIPPGALKPFYPRPPVHDTSGLGSPYVVLHPGTGAIYKEWSIQNWVAVAKGIRAAGFDVAVTGSGDREEGFGRTISEAVPGVTSLAGKIGWDQFVAILSRARGLICVDTVASHVAAAFDVPTIAIFTGINKPEQWGPHNARARVISYPVPCAPCNRSGCNLMHCVRFVDPAVVLKTFAAVLAGH